MALDPERPVTLPKVTAEGSAPGYDLLENIRKLETRFERAQGEIEKLKESDRSWLKKAGLVLGFLGGLIATPRLIKETYEVLFTRANTTILWGAPLNIRYDQHDRVLRLDF